MGDLIKIQEILNQRILMGVKETLETIKEDSNETLEKLKVVKFRTLPRDLQERHKKLWECFC